MTEKENVDLRSVFVKGVSFEVSNEQFQEAFSEVGPIRRAFLLQNKDAAHHRGSGFVQFALIEDAARAVKEYNNKILLGRTIQVTPASKRATPADRKTQREERKMDDVPEEKKARKKVLGHSIDGKKALRTIAVGGFQQQDAEDALKLASLCGKVENSIMRPDEQDIGSFKLQQDGCTGSVIFITFASIKEAFTAVTKLHGTEFKLRKKKKLQTSDPQKTLWARQLAGEGAMVKKLRLILRNLPFNVKEEDLRTLLSPAGFVRDISIPLKDGKQRGFAFASFTSRAHAEKAIKAANGQKLKGRVLAVDWAVSKAAFQTVQSTQESEKEAGNEEDILDAEEQENRSLASSDDEGGEDIAPDEEKARSKRLASQFLDSLDQEDTQLKGRKRHREEKGDEDKGKDLEDNDSLEESPSKLTRLNDSSKGIKSTNDTQKQNVLSPSSEAPPQQKSMTKTVFARGLGTDVQKAELQSLLEQFGHVRACRIVMNSATSKPKGTAFIEFETSEEAQKAAEACAKGRSGGGPGILYRGKQIEVDIALTQEDARSMASSGNYGSLPASKRNLYLAQEGTIDQQSQAWSQMSKPDQMKRLRAGQEKATKLKSPNFFISTTRLSIRNLPGSVDEKTLKELLLAAVKERATKAKPKLKQVKVLRDNTRLTKEGDPTSKGIAFAEFTDHEHALCALRQLNNNPGPFGKEKRPIIEFALENAQTLKARQQRETGRKGRSSLQGHDKAVEEQPRRDVKQGKQDRKKEKKDPKEPKKTVSRDEKKKEGLVKTNQKNLAIGQTSNASIDLKTTKPTKIVEQKTRGKPKPDKLESNQLKPKKPKMKEKRDALDKLVDKYRASLLSTDNKAKDASKPNKGQTGLQKGLKRWFE